jgi:hypothetical protein
MRSIGLGLVFATAMGLVSATASADNGLQSSFTGLVAKGFEVKSVTLIPLEVAKRVTDKVRTDNVIVTLQKDETVAVCYVAFANWAFMNKASLDSPTLCEVRTPPTEASAAPPAAAPSSTSSTEPPAAPAPSSSEMPPAAPPAAAPAPGGTTTP